MTVTFAEKLARMPHYEPGTSLDDAAASGGDRRRDQARLQRVAGRAAPRGGRGDRRGRLGGEPLPRPRGAAAAHADRRPQRDRARPGRRLERLLRDPARRRRGALRARRRDRLRVALVLDLPAHDRALRRARGPGAARPRATCTTSTRCAAEITAATQIAIVCNPNNPTGTAPAGRADRRVPRRGARPRHRDRRRGLHRVPDRWTTPTRRSTCWPTTRTWSCCRTFSKCYGLAGLRVGYALCSPQFRAAVDAVRQPFSVNAVAQAAAAEAILHQDDVADRVERNLVERVHVEEGVRELGLDTPDSQANFSWVDLGDSDEGEVVASLAKARRRRAPRHAARRPGPLPRHLRHPRREREISRRARERLVQLSPLDASLVHAASAASARAASAATAPRAHFGTSGDLARRPARGCPSRRRDTHHRRTPFSSDATRQGPSPYQ